MGRRARRRARSDSASPADRLSALEQQLRRLAQRHSLARLFSDWVELSALALVQPFTQDPYREACYLRRIQAYTPEEREGLSEAFALFVLYLEAAGFCNGLGDLYQRLELHSPESGIVFTPYPVCQLMARMLCEDVAARVAAQGFVTACEPAVGSGAMVIALAEAFQAEGVNYQRCLHVTAVDINVTCFYMAYIQLALYHVPALLYHGDTLANTLWACWPTPAHVLGFWGARLRRREALPAPDTLPPTGTQLTFL